MNIEDMKNNIKKRLSDKNGSAFDLSIEVVSSIMAIIDDDSLTDTEKVDGINELLSVVLEGDHIARE